MVNELRKQLRRKNKMELRERTILKLDELSRLSDMEKVIDKLKTLQNGLFKDEQAVIRLIDETIELVEIKVNQFDVQVKSIYKLLESE